MSKSSLNSWTMAGLAVKALALVLAARYLYLGLHGLYADFSAASPAFPAPDPRLAGTGWDLLNAPITQLNLYIGYIWQALFLGLTLWNLGRLFAAMAEGGRFEAQLRGVLRGIGACLAVAMLPKIFIVTLVAGAPRLGVELSMQPIALVLVGAGLFVVAHQARRVEARLDQFV